MVYKDCPNFHLFPNWEIFFYESFQLSNEGFSTFWLVPVFFQLYSQMWLIFIILIINPHFFLWNLLLRPVNSEFFKQYRIVIQSVGLTIVKDSLVLWATANLRVLKILAQYLAQFIDLFFNVLLF